jgi:GNAT superfamily N-acetyltransferase
MAMNKTSKYFWPDLSADPQRIDSFTRVIEPVQKAFLAEKPTRKNAWYLSTLAVHPEFRGHGYGTMLLNLGLERVDGQGVVSWLVALKGVEPLYEKNGFVVRGRANVGELADWDGGAIMIRE